MTTIDYIEIGDRQQSIDQPPEADAHQTEMRVAFYPLKNSHLIKQLPIR
jgi:hypothetical protein